MLQTFIHTLTDPQVLIAAFSAITVAATVIGIALPLMDRDRLPARMKSVAVERERIRARERAKLERNRISLRTEPRAYMRSVVERFNLREALVDENTISRLRMAGYRGQAPLTVFLFFRFMLPFVVFAGALVYFFVLSQSEQPFFVKICYALLAGGVGFYLPVIFISNKVQKRADLHQAGLAGCARSRADLRRSRHVGGGGVPQGAEEIGGQSPPLAEELLLTTAELSYLPDRRQAYDNLALRTGIDQVKSVVMALTQAERYGTPLGQSLRVMAQESRDQRMNEAEKKAAALPPKLTVPMILFFLPVLFAVVAGPAAIQIMQVRH